MPVFPSRGWMEAFCDCLRAHPRAAEVAEALDGRYRFVVEPAGPLSRRHSYDVLLRPAADGGPPEVSCVDDDAAGPPRLTLTADYTRWRQLIRGELDLGMAVMFRRLRVSGELGSLMSRLSSTEPLAEALGLVDTRWLDGDGSETTGGGA